MADNSFSEVSSESWFGRIGGALKGILVGLLMFVVSFPVIIWNEKRAVDTSVGLEQAQSMVLTVAAAPVLKANDGKLIHFTAESTTDETLKDSEFGVSLNAVKLSRTVAMYQWREESQSTTEKNLGGGTETVTTYNYDKIWSSDLINSNNFKKSAEYSNPGSMPYSSTSYTASKVMAGDFVLPASLLDQLQDWKTIDPGENVTLPDGFVQRDRELIRGNPDAPEIGDLRITYSAIFQGPISVIAQQIGISLEAFQTKTGTSVEIIEPGTLGAENMFKKAQASNASLTWIFRLVGLLLMGVGIALVLNPLKVVADVVPIIGTIIGGGIGIIAGLLALALTAITIAITWIAVRPVLGVILLVVAGAAFYGIRTHIAKKRSTEAA